jgi:DNA-directed RNA polymerase subunit N (RpoN/RPB10)
MSSEGNSKGRWSSCRGTLPKEFNEAIELSWLDRPSRRDVIPYTMPITSGRHESWNTEYWDPLDASSKPIRCFSCSRVLGHRYTPYWLEVNKYGHDADVVVGHLGIEPTSYCCKQMLMTYTSIPVQSVGKGHKIVCE